MIIIKALIPLKQRQREKALALLHELAEQSRQEAGCLACDILLQPRAPDTVVMLQQWRCTEALEAHFASSHVERFVERLPELVAGEITATRYEVLEVADEPEQHPEHERAEVLFSGEVTIH